MLWYLFKMLFLIVFSGLIIWVYYNTQWGIHKENFDWYVYYFLTIWIIYGVYKYFQIEYNQQTAYFSPLKIIGYFLGHLFILCLFYFIFNEQAMSYGIVMFFKILWFLLLPTFITLISFWVGKKMSSFFPALRQYSSTFQWIIAFWMWFFLFFLWLAIIWIFGFYNIYFILALFIIFFVFSYKEIINILRELSDQKFEKNIVEGNYLKLLSTEFLFWVSTLVLWVTLINIMRPFPIGWDDLWVYMNVPHLLAEAGSFSGFWWMYGWQIFTGVWYLFWSANQAFFLNALGGFLSFILLIVIFWDIFSSKKKWFIDIPFLLATVFISMPMVVFEQAKDMKLDPGLFAISISVLYLVYTHFSQKSYSFMELIKEKIWYSKKEKLLASRYILIVIWLLLGLAFLIKFTSLLLIIGVFWLVTFKRIGFIGLVGYISMFLAVFTQWNLWKYMNIILPYHNETFISVLVMILWCISICSFGFVFIKYKKIFQKFLSEISIILIAFILALTPWIAKNIYSAEWSVSIGTILSGKSDYFAVDFEKIHTSEKIDEINQIKAKERETDNGTTANEDFWRYFGYEQGILNYIKLPWNLTMQVNQKGEFTDIGYIFLALLPAIFLFLPWRRSVYAMMIPLLLIFELWIFIWGWLQGILGNITLPFWYLVLLGMTFIPLCLIYLGLKNTFKSQDEAHTIELFQSNLVFAWIYVFLWMLAAYGVVWYWITMYFCFLLMIGVWVYYISTYDWKHQEEDDNIYLWTLLGSLGIFLIFLIYISNSVFPHTFNNLKWARYIEYKMWKVNANEALYVYHRDYLKILFELNIADDKKKDFLQQSIDKKIGEKYPNVYTADINAIEAFLKWLEISKDILSVSATKSLQNIYAGISNPTAEFKNQNIIYRAGTFLKYNISENNTRIFEDGLLFSFNDFIYNDSRDITIENFKKLWVTYLLLDLNAATIDKSQNHDLTTRYEKMLWLFVSDKLELIETDSVCLKIWIENYKNNEDKDIDKFMSTAWVNYESYSQTGAIIHRNMKKMWCYEEMIRLFQSGKVNERDYSYLIDDIKFIQKNTQYQDSNMLLNYLHTKYGNSFKVLFKIK